VARLDARISQPDEVALDSVDAMPIQEDWRENNRKILQNNLAFMDDCLAKGVISLAAAQEFARIQGPFLD
jgi:hypothetical protein